MYKHIVIILRDSTEKKTVMAIYVIDVQW